MPTKALNSCSVRIQCRFKRSCLCPGLFQDWGASADLAVTLAHFVNDLRRGGTITAHIQEIRFDFVHIVWPTISHYQ